LPEHRSDSPFPQNQKGHPPARVMALVSSALASGYITRASACD
jgi:hypothetical protein